MARGKKQPSETILLTGIRQGQGQTVSKAFGSSAKQPRRSKRRGRNGSTGSLACWDAFHPNHLTLPRTVAPYTVIRTTTIWSPGIADHRRFAIFGPQWHEGTSAGVGDAGRWSSGFCFHPLVPLSSLMGATAGWQHEVFTTMNTSSWAASTVAPAAFSIQVMNPEALQTTNGMIYIGRAKNRLNLEDMDNSMQIQELCDSLVAYSNPTGS